MGLGGAPGGRGTEKEPAQRKGASHLSHHEQIRAARVAGEAPQLMQRFLSHQSHTRAKRSAGYAPHTMHLFLSHQSHTRARCSAGELPHRMHFAMVVFSFLFMPFWVQRFAFVHEFWTRKLWARTRCPEPVLYTGQRRFTGASPIPSFGLNIRFGPHKTGGQFQNSLIL